MRVALLAGGTGAARLAMGLVEVIDASDLSIITNTADDDEFWGLLVCPDTDSVLYRLAGIFNAQSGFGIVDETFGTLAMLGRLGEPTWFGLGDQDIALHLLRQQLLRGGMRLTEAIAELGRRLGVRAHILPMTDAPVRTRFATDVGDLSFQEYFVREHCGPQLREVQVAGIEQAKATPEVISVLSDADIVIIGPSNPIVSIGPILDIVGALMPRERVVAVSPVVGGRSLKGPTVTMLAALGHGTDALAVARLWAPHASTFVLDVADAAAAPAVQALGMEVRVLDTVMHGQHEAAGLSRHLLAATTGSSGSG
ncbi:MAG: 2-phospho-L-lactate transferase [Candidatus Dormibacteria bacterium]